MAGINPENRSQILSRFPFESGSLPVRYLGLPLLTKRMSLHDYTPLIEKVRSRVSSWTARYLSFAGRLQLIASVIQSLTSFWISAFRLPLACIEEIDKICAAFLWSGPELNTKKAKVAWTDVCKPKSEGGLGLRPLSEANTVSCLKLLWRIHSNQPSLWVNWVRRYLIRKGSLWSVNNSTSLGSWTWKTLLKYRNLAASLSKVEIHNGANASFWFDKWTSLGRLIDITGTRGCIDFGINLYSSVATAMDSRRVRRHRSATLNEIETAISTYQQQGLSTDEDVVLWKCSRNNFKQNFSSKATWNLIRNTHATVDWHKGIWFPYSTPKYSFLAWLAILNRLSTGDRMLSWSTGVLPACSLCLEPHETRNHIFFACPFSATIWRALAGNLLRTHFSTHWDTLVSMISDSRHEKITLFLLRYVFQVAIHTIWRERNKRRHGDPPTPHNHLIRFIDKQVRNRLSTINASGDLRFQRGLQVWFATR